MKCMKNSVGPLAAGGGAHSSLTMELRARTEPVIKTEFFCKYPFNDFVNKIKNDKITFLTPQSTYTEFLLSLLCL